MKKGMNLTCFWIFCMLFVSCEIEDDFGNTDDIPLKSAISLSVDASWIYWIDEENIIYWQSGSFDIGRVNIQTKATTPLYTLKNLNPNEYYSAMLALTSQNNLLTVIAGNNGTPYNTTLCLVNLETDEITRLPGAFEFTGTKNFVLDDTHLAYASPHDGVIDILLYDLNTGEIDFVGPGVPIVFSPDGTSLLCEDYSSGTYLYNLNSKTQGPAPVSLSYNYNPQVRWNDQGITEANISYYQTGIIEVHNLTTNTSVTRTSVISPDNIYLSPSGHRLIHSNASCPSPYLKFCPDQGSKIAILMADIPSNDDLELFDEKVSTGFQISIEQLEFSPDENRIAFIRNGRLLVSPD